MKSLTHSIFRIELFVIIVLSITIILFALDDVVGLGIKDFIYFVYQYITFMFLGM